MDAPLLFQAQAAWIDYALNNSNLALQTNCPILKQFDMRKLVIYSLFTLLQNRIDIRYLRFPKRVHRYSKLANLYRMPSTVFPEGSLHI